MNGNMALMKGNMAHTKGSMAKHHVRNGYMEHWDRVRIVLPEYTFSGTHSQHAVASPDRVRIIWFTTQFHLSQTKIK